MHAPQNTPPQLRWALPVDLHNLPHSAVQQAQATAHMAILGLSVALCAALLLIATGSALSVLPGSLVLTGAGVLLSTRRGLLGLSRGLLILSTGACCTILLARFNASALDALALAPAAMLIFIQGRERIWGVLAAMLLPALALVSLRSLGTPTAAPESLHLLAPIALAATVCHSLWRQPLQAPAKPVVLAPKPAPAPEPVVNRHAPPPGQPLRVLVVDDIPVNRLVVQRMLQAKGLTVLEAGSGAEALEVLENNEVDLVFLDLHMPGLDGIEVARRIRARGDRVPLVALTADSVAGTREACLAAGMDAFLNKPAPPQVLFQLVEGLTVLQSKAAS